MTDKQIIIDVSDCSELCGTKCHILMSCTNTSKSDSCSEMPNCYYKQLKRSEAQCEAMFVSHTDLEKKYKAKEQECEVLNADNISLKYRVGKLERAIVRRNKQLDQLKAENDELRKSNCKFKNYCTCDIENFLQILTEIKEIAEEAGNTQYLTFPDFDLKQNAKMLMGQFNGYLQQILQKISEVENDR